MALSDKRGRGVASQINNYDQSDLSAIESIQRNESTTFLQPTFAPKMMHLSKFLEPFDETSLTDEDAAQKYSTYIGGFLKDQLSDQFERHKNSAWFRDKYHPDHSVSLEQQRSNLVARFEAFKKMYDEGHLNGVPLEYKERKSIMKILDRFTILLANGTPKDLAELDTFDPCSLIANGINVETEGQKYHASMNPKSHSSKKQSLTPKAGDRSPEKSKRGRKNQKGNIQDGDGGNDSDSSTSSYTSSASSSASAVSSHSSSSSSSMSSAATSSHSARSHSHSSSSVSSSSSSSSTSSTSSSKTMSASKMENDMKNIEKGNGKIGEAQGDGTEANVKMEIEETVEVREVTEEKDEEEMRAEKERSVRPPPLHATRVVYLPYFPLSVHRATVETLLSEHPDFLRFACLDPTPMPASPNHSLGDTFVPSVAASSLLLHRPAWITFTATPTNPTSTPPLDFIRHLVSRLRADSPSAPSEASDLAAALSVARNLPSPFNLDRIRASTRLATTLMATVKSDNFRFNPISSKSVMRRHLVMAARLAGRLDEVWALWRPSEEQTHLPIPRSTELDPRRGSLIGAASTLVDLASSTGNPLLENLTDYLVDESNPDEEVMMLSTRSERKTKKVEKEDEEGDAELATALDKLLLYLRLVYSVDFYAPAIYPKESDMPHPCAIMHVRPSKLPTMTSTLTSFRLMPSPPSPVFGKEASSRSAHKVFARQISRIFRFVTPLAIGTIAKLQIAEQKEGSFSIGQISASSAENPEQQQQQQQQQPAEVREMDTNERRLRILGYRDPAEIVEAFIKANTKRKKRKVDVIWVCPLSDKKFRGPGFVRKHIMNKHAEKVEEAKKENAYFFNNFLLDPMRPELMRPPRRHLPLRRGNITSAAAPSSASSAGEDDGEGGDLPRDRLQSYGGGAAGASRDDLPPSHSTRYWYSRNNGVGRSYGRGVSGGNNQRRYGRPNPWGSEQRWAGSGGGYYRRMSNRGSSYRDLDAPY